MRTRIVQSDKTLMNMWRAFEEIERTQFNIDGRMAC